MGYQAALDALNPDHVVNDQYFEEQAEAQVEALAKAGLLVPSNQEVDQIEAGAKLVGDAFFDDMRLWFTFTDRFRDLGGPHRARSAAAAVAARALAEAGWTTPQASSAERSQESLVSAIAESLRDFKFEVGPNTMEMLKAGQAVYLTPEERHQLAHAAANAYREVVQRDDL